jgi:nitrite reductase/ring-hydroxylating ferredoxin subunit
MVLSLESNEILTRVGPGTPMGTLLRRFWLPALLSSELSEPDGAPLRLRIMGEDLVAFRDTKGQVGILSGYCRHKLAPLFFGRNEACGLRCVYHGWKFDVNGACLEMPNVPAEQRRPGLLERAAITAYPTQEAGGMIWVYMGPKDKLPVLPIMEWMNVPAGHAHVARWLQRTNWAQGMEGEIDTSHVSFLHSSVHPDDMPLPIKYAIDGAPIITLRETDCGFVYGARRTYGDQYYWRITQWMAPMWSGIAGPLEPFLGQGRAWVPIDDYHTMTFGYNYRPDRPYTPREIQELEEGRLFPPRIQKGTFELPHGYVIDTFLPLANKSNDYLLDRRLQKTTTFTGILGVNEQDRSLQEYLPGRDGERGLVDRSREFLVASDAPVVAARRRLVKLATDLQEGIEPKMASQGDFYRVRPLSKLTPIVDFDTFIEKFGNEMHARYPA